MLLRRTARPLLASWFVYEGLEAARKPSEHVVAARGPADRVATRFHLSRLTDRQLTTLVRVHGGLTVAAGLGLALGRAPRRSALLLAALTAPLAVANEPFSKPAATRSDRVERFVRNLGALGAALLAGVDYEGKPGLTWRVENARAERAHLKEVKAAAKAD